MAKYINEIVIVGGGTSGWLAAKTLSRRVSFTKVTLIDKEVSEPVGVGEATLLSFKVFLEKVCFFSEYEIGECLYHCESIKKNGILFPDWGIDGNEIWHPFYFGNMIPNGIDRPLLIDAWSLQDTVDIGEIMPDRIKSGATFAEHINALKLVEYLKNSLLNDDSHTKINYIQSAVKDITRDDNGISSLTLEDGSVISGDIFVDCTGFKSILKDKRDRVDLSDRLYVDTAVAGHIDYLDEKEITPYVSCPAVDHGWIWKIPLRTRMGTGLVFNRNITDPEEAKQYFVDYWDGRLDKDSLKIIDWTPYYDTNQWDKNVVSIGLSAGFLEPLESTGIELILQGITKLSDVLEARWYNNMAVNNFNNYMIDQFETSVDFVNMHYSISTKDTPFWNYVRNNYKPSETLKIFSDNLNSQEPSIYESPSSHFIGGGNWIHWMVQLGYSMDKKEYLLGKKKIRDKSLEIDTGVMDILMDGINWVKNNGH
tara:strand:+ start:4880 stop:6322 length:1443 start_codon:yes stop_codon:yes gene_type:complete